MVLESPETLMDLDEHVSINTRSMRASVPRPKMRNLGVLNSTDLLGIPEDLREEAIVSSPCVEVRRKNTFCCDDRSVGNEVAAAALQRRLTVAGKDDELCRSARRISTQVLRDGRKSLIVNSFTPDALSATPQRRAPANPVSPPRDAETDFSSVENGLQVAVRTQRNRLSLLLGDWEQILTEEGDQIPEGGRRVLQQTMNTCKNLLADLSALIAGSSSQPFAERLEKFRAFDLEVHRIDNAFQRIFIWRERFDWAEGHMPETPAQFKKSSASSRRRSRTQKVRDAVGRKLRLFKARHH